MSKRVWNLIIGFGLIILGIFLIIKPDQTFENLIMYIGIALLIVGVLKIVSSIINKQKMLLPGSVIFNGVLNILLGIILITTSSITIKLISIFIGIWLIMSSLSKLLFLYNFKEDIVKYNMFLQILKLIIGIIVLTTPVITSIFSGLVIGIILIVIGIWTIINEKEEEKIYKVRVK